jgi:hypothetical protein
MKPRPSRRATAEPSADIARHPLVERFRREVPRQYAAWSESLFEQYVRGPGAMLWAVLGGDASSCAEETDEGSALESWLTLVREAIAAGYVRGADAERPGSVLELCLARLVPEQLPHWKSPERSTRLAAIWNLCEGLLGQPRWVDQYVLARMAQLDRLEDLETFLTKVLGPVLSPLPPSDWRGELRHTVLDTRPLDDEFLPGEMTLAAPGVVSIRDRTGRSTLGVLLQRGGRSELIGPMPPVSAAYREDDPPPVRLERSAALVQGRRAELPLLTSPYRALAVGSGFVVASAVDSQRLWILECAG